MQPGFFMPFSLPGTMRRHSGEFRFRVCLASGLLAGEAAAGDIA